MVLITKKDQPKPLHHKKRTGQHHTRSKHYIKHYWPYLPLLAIAGFSLLLNAVWAPVSQTFTGHGVLSYATSAGQAGLLAATNSQRSANNEIGLLLNSQLSKAAQAKAEDMVRRNYWSHTTPDGREPWWFIESAGYQYQTVGENLAYGFDSSDAAVTGWMNSPGHRANILNSQFKDVGFGIANSEDFNGNGPETVIVAMYGTSVMSASTVPPALPAPATNPASPTGQTRTSTAATPTTGTTAPHSTTSSSPSPQVAAAHVPAQPSNRPQPVTRLQTLGVALPVVNVLTVTLVVAAAAALFIYRHAKAVHRYLVQGEALVVEHPVIDIAAISLISLSIVLTRTTGFIQ